jgi:hypothetical protein
MAPEPETQIADTVTVDGWTLRFMTLVGGEQERFDPLMKVVKIDHTDRVWAMAHVTAHLDLGHIGCEPQPFTERQEWEATALASFRLDLNDNGGKLT